MPMPDDDVSLGELHRTMKQLQAAVDRLSGQVEGISVLEYRVGKVEEDVKEITRNRRTDWRTVLTALIAPAVIIIFQFWYTRGSS